GSATQYGAIGLRWLWGVSDLAVDRGGELTFAASWLSGGYAKIAHSPVLSAKASHPLLLQTA
ncbi:hypothetical protein BMI90_18325, partial [Thioclava sp. L04-15]|uniref:hypothetical protein n=1 Tax=Thioclava sp. L04-15 TaxID=1915318 RepID=UPI0009C6ECCF